MAVYGYTRVSTETQSEKGYGLQTQRDAIAQYAAEQGLVLAQIFEDAGVSGAAADDASADEAIGKRQGLLALLAAIKAGDTVIVQNTNRLWRADITKAIIKRELLNHDAKLISLQQPGFSLESTSASEYLTNTLLEALDVYERMTITAKLAQGRTTKAQGGNKPAGLAPYGYSYAPDKKSLVVNADEAAAVKAMFSAAQRGNSLQDIACQMNEQGIRTRRGNAWSRGSIQAILKNDFYTGVLTHQGARIKGKHTPIISRVQFGKVQAQLAAHRKRA